jgi:DNA-binding Lrp family transcriptional regulator
MDNTDKKLLDIIQDEFPLTSEPYREIASLLGVSEEEVILRLRKLKDKGIIRRIGAIFDSKKLGYCSTLCAMKVPAQRVDEVAQIVNEYPGVTHNYLRSEIPPNPPFSKGGTKDDLSKGGTKGDSSKGGTRDDEYNLWFTITARSQSELDRVMAEIREKSGIRDLIDLPAVRMFKIRVRFPMFDTEEDTREKAGKPEGRKAGRSEGRLSRLLSPEFEGIVRELQGDIALCRRPFESIANRLGIEEEELLTKLRELRDCGVMRRFSAILRHRNVGISANAMGIWRVPEDKAEEVGAKMARFPQVSHCYQRIIQPGWPYNVFTMIHGRTVEDCQQVANLISQDTGIKDYRLLYSTRELKKVSMRYFI